ncbi:AraC family transcriptional regulator [Gracilibacillus sp. HCP3S3_G5_1]|uniref:AraC family transcriptional regulator n=1 Tax=unclassified Gracilibacillus TaxID=2625209 RepID=UPI003F8B2564
MKDRNRTTNDNSFTSFSFVYKSTKDPQKELPKHLHDFYEIIYVYSGKGVFFIKDTLYDMGKGDIFIIPNNTIHHARPEKRNPVTSSVIFVHSSCLMSNTVEESYSFLHLFEQIKKVKKYKITLHQDQITQFEDKLSSINKEFTSSDIGCRHASLLIVQQIIINLYRIFAKTTSKQNEAIETYSYSWINEILEYIERNIHTKLTLSELANQALVSPAHLSRVFKETTGMNVTSYINQKRIIVVKELLIEDNYTINNIAELTGFESMPHFYRTFKKYTGMTPSAYRKKHHTSHHLM